MYQKDSGDKKYFRVLNILNRLNEGPVRVAALAAEFGVTIPHNGLLSDLVTDLHAE